MNQEATTLTGYYGSYMYNTVLPEYLEAFKQVFGEHIVKRNIYATSKVDNDFISSGHTAWGGIPISVENPTVSINLLDEMLIMGSNIYSASALSSESFQLPLFYLAPHYIVAKTYSGQRRSYWTRTVANSTAFACLDTDGTPWARNADDTVYVRPYWLIG